jgi:RNA dependent RNA polymerase
MIKYDDVLFQDKLKRGERKQISIPSRQGRNMMGVLDETGQLEYGQVFVRYSVNSREAPEVVTGEHGVF